MGDLIVLAVKAVAGLFWLFFQGIRLAGLALGGVIGVTEQLVRQRSSGARFSPDRRYWWNGSRWVPARHPIAWLIPGGTALLLVVALGVCIANIGSSPTATVNTSSNETVIATPSADPEADPSALPPATASSLPASNGKATCGDPHAHVYSPDRLQLLASCVTVNGIVDVIRTEADGDLHVLVRLDPGQDKYLNAKNISAENGDLVTEPVCVDTPTQADAIPACQGYRNTLPIPALDTHVAVSGAWVLDLDHGWMEIHPVFAYNGVTGAPASPAAPPPSPSPAPLSAAPAAVNLCGAPANPWSYTFCGGNLIYSPDPGFCSYFLCISSFPNGTGYVVQCVDGKFSKSGGHTGVCSQHGGFKRNLYSP